MRGVREVQNRLLWRVGQARSAGPHTHTTWSNDAMVKRIRNQEISVESVDFKARHNAKTAQAWKYKGGQVVRAASTRLGSRVYHDPKESGLPRRKHESNFFITINTNKVVSADGAKERSFYDMGVLAMKNMLETLARDRNIATYLKFGPKDAAYLDDLYGDVVQSVDWNSSVETGPEKNRLHAHIWMTITHYSQVQINIPVLMQLAKQAYNHSLPATTQFNALRLTSNMYVHVKLLPQSDWTDVMRSYIHKGMMGASG